MPRLLERVPYISTKEALDGVGVAVCWAKGQSERAVYLDMAICEGGLHTIDLREALRR